MQGQLRTSRLGGLLNSEPFSLAPTQHAPLSCAKTLGAFPAELVGTWSTVSGIRTQVFQFSADGAYRSVLTYSGTLEAPTTQGFRAVVQGQATCAGGELLMIATQGHIEIAELGTNTISKGSYPPGRACMWLVDGDMLILTDSSGMQAFVRANNATLV